MATFAEQDELDRILERHGAHLEVTTVCEVRDGSARFPVRAVCLGSTEPDAPGIGFFGGVHGLERIGSQVVLSFLADIVRRIGRDGRLADILQSARLVFMPIVNPVGMFRGTRANANGVDLMRNAPLHSRERVAFLVGGQTVSRRLPWFRGDIQCMEAESRALCGLVEHELLSRPFSIALDCHSGFGMIDRIWFPHACTSAPFAHLAEVHVLLDEFRRAHPDSAYRFEPQSYRTHGDLWDYLCLQARARGRGVFIPLTLEMGSWRWVRKNPRQVLRLDGIFNPLPPDRVARVRRNHFEWLEFLCDAVPAYEAWLPQDAAREHHYRAGLATWFGARA